MPKKESANRIAEPEGDVEMSEAEDLALRLELAAWNRWLHDQEVRLNLRQDVNNLVDISVWQKPPIATACHWCGHTGPLHHAYDHIIPCGPTPLWLHTSCWERRQHARGKPAAAVPPLPPPNWNDPGLW